MPPKKRRIKKRKNKRHVLLVFFLIVVSVFLFFEESGKDRQNRSPAIFKAPPRTKTSRPAKLPSGKLPKIAIVMDDLGPNRAVAETVLALNAPLTLSILPHETYSKWIAKEGYRLGHQIIAHIPMEAVTPQRLGKGALRRSMSDHDIARTLAEDIRSIPHVSGVSNHMGSAFTKDKRTMRAAIMELKKNRLFFLDSFTTHESIGYKLAIEEGLAALRRDVFLDNKDDLHEMEVQWKRLVKISRKKAHAIVLAHPRKKTLGFLQNKLENNNEVIIVPLSELFTD